MWCEHIPLTATTIHCEERCSLGEPINLYELPPEFSFNTFNGACWGWGTGHNNTYAPATWNFPRPCCCCIENHVCYCRCTTQHSDAVLVDTSQNFSAVYFAQNNVFATHCGHRINHAPTIAMKLRKCVQVNIAIIHTKLPTKGCRVHPQVAMRELNTLRASSGATGVVHRCSGIFIWCPSFRLNTIFIQDAV